MALFSRKKDEKTRRKSLVFLVEDNVVYARQVELFLRSKFGEKIEIMHFPVAETAEVKLEHGTIPEVIVMDHFLDGQYEDASLGLDMLKKIKETYPKIHLILLSSQESIELAVSSISEGICDYIPKGGRAMAQLEKLLSKYLT